MEKELENLREPFTSDTSDPVNKIEGQPPPREGEDIVKELMNFEQPFQNLPKSYLWNTYIKLVWENLKMTPYVTGQIFITASGFYYLNLAGDPLEQAAFGLYTFLYLVSFLSILYSGADKLGISLSNAFGAKNYQKLREISGMGALTYLLLFLTITVPALFLAEPLFTATNISPELARAVAGPCRLSLVMSLIQLLNEVIQTFCMAQGLEHYFGNIGLVNVAFSVPGNYFFIYRLKLGQYGFIYSKLIAETVRLMLSVMILRKTHPETKKFASLADTLKNYKVFLWDSLKFTLGTYSEYIGFEICGYLVALTNDKSQITAYYSIQNYAGIPYSIGITFSVIGRTRTNILIGMKKNHIAKNFYLFFILATSGFGFLFGMGMIVTRDFVAGLYGSSSPDLKDWMKGLIVIYGLSAWSEMMMYVNEVGMKTIGKINLLLRFSMCTMFLGNSTVGSLISHYNGNVWHLFGWSMILAVSMSCLMMGTVFTFDWNQISKRKSSVDQDSIDDMLERELQNIPVRKRSSGIIMR